MQGIAGSAEMHPLFLCPINMIPVKERKGSHAIAYTMFFATKQVLDKTAWQMWEFQWT